MVSLYYSSDSEIEQDSELQAWIKDVVDEGFVDVPEFGQFPKRKSSIVHSTALVLDQYKWSLFLTWNHPICPCEE